MEIRVSHRLPGYGRIVRRLAVPVGVALALGLVITPVGAAAGRPLDCGSSFDPYAYTRAAVSACGYKTFPLAGVKAMPGGGSSYDYRVNGSVVRFYVPPKGFDPSTASAAKLNEYGFPPRPEEAAALSRWDAQMRSWKGSAKPSPFLAETHMVPATTYSENWSGYDVTGSAGTYTHAEAWYLEPTIYSSRCSTNAEVTWAGIGGNGSGDPLGQDGTGYGVPGLGAHQAWWYILPGYNGAVPVSGLFGHSGYVFDASTRWLGDAYRFYMEDYYSDTTMAFDVGTSSYSGDSAEAIAERPRINDVFSNLSNFGTLTFEQTEANGVYFNNYSPNGIRNGIHMYNQNNDDDLADPSDIGSDGYFTDTQQNCN